MGRKSKYETHVLPHLDKIPEWYQFMTQAQICRKLGISVKTWESYKKTYPELLESLKKGKEELVCELKSVLKKKALGFYYTDVKEKSEVDENGNLVVVERHSVTRYCPPDLGSIHLLLKNLDENWHNDDTPTLKLKQEQIEIQKQKADSDFW